MGRSARNKIARQKRILEELQRNAAVRVGDLAEVFGVSGETIRRDLAELGSEGAVNRTYGGAVVKPILQEPEWRARHDVYPEERRAIAARTIGLISPGDVVIMEVGSTMMHLAEALAANSRDLSVITSSLDVALTLGRNDSITVHLCPGVLDSREASVIGNDTVAYLQRFNATIAIVGSTGITSEGLQESHIGIAAIKCAMLARAKTRVAILDRSKFGQTGMVTACPLSDIDTLVTDRAPHGELAAALEQAGVQVIVAGPVSI